MAVKAEAGTPKAKQTPGKTPKSGKKEKKNTTTPGLAEKMNTSTPKTGAEHKTPKKRKLQEDNVSPSPKVQAVLSPTGKPARENGTPATPKDKKNAKGAKKEDGGKAKAGGEAKEPQTPASQTQENGSTKKKRNRRLNNKRRRLLKKEHELRAREKVNCPTKFIVKFKTPYISLKDPIVQKVLKIVSHAKSVNNTNRNFRVKFRDRVRTLELYNQMKEMPGKQFTIRA